MTIAMKDTDSGCTILILICQILLPQLGFIVSQVVVSSNLHDWSASCACLNHCCYILRPGLCCLREYCSRYPKKVWHSLVWILGQTFLATTQISKTHVHTSRASLWMGTEQGAKCSDGGTTKVPSAPKQPSPLVGLLVSSALAPSCGSSAESRSAHFPGKVSTFSTSALTMVSARAKGGE